jgi:opacity protein-like surface antigen
MRQSKKAIAIATLIIIASSPATADDTRGFYSGAGAGYMPAGELNLQPVSAVEESLAAFGGFRLNSQFALEGFYADINPMALLSKRSSNLYTQSFLGTGLADNAISTLAGLSVVTTLIERGPVRPFARAGLHHYDLEDGSVQSLRGDSLLLGAGANIDLSRGWNARLEWERYSDVDRMDLDIFSANIEYKF